MDNSSERPLGWTTLEEAKQLVEAGLNPDTADMWISPKGIYIGRKETPIKYETFPCWSLGALLELIPAEITYSDFKPFKLGIFKDDNKDECHYFIQYYPLYESGVFCQTSGHTLVEASINMILYLLNNGFIKYEQENCK